MSPHAPDSSSALAAVAVALTGALRRLCRDRGVSPAVVRAPRLAPSPRPASGSFLTDAATSLATVLETDAREVAREVIERLNEHSGWLAESEVQSSGLISLQLAPEWLTRSLAALAGTSSLIPPLGSVLERGPVQVEFVSADPTGPLLPEHGRGAVVGDVLARMFREAGISVSRESYLNDGAAQVERLSALLNGVNHLPPAERGYFSRLLSRGDPAPGQAAWPGAGPAGREAMAAVIRDHQDTLASLGVHMDTWRSEADLLREGKDGAVVATLLESGQAYRHEGAIWLASSRAGDTQDRALVRSNGRPTYLATDLAYHTDKLQRGFDRLIDVWGPSHAPYVPRTRAGARALEISDEQLVFLVFGTVRVEGMGGLRTHSTTLEEVISLTGPDALRLQMLLRPLEQLVEIDVDRLSQRDAQNPFWEFTLCLRELQTAAESPGGPDWPGGLSDADISPEDSRVLTQIASLPALAVGALIDLNPTRPAIAGMELCRELRNWLAGPAGAALPGVKRLGAAAGLAVLRALGRLLGLRG